MSSFSTVDALAAPAAFLTHEVGQLPAATGAAGLSALLIGLPLLGAVILLVGGRALDKVGHWIAIVMVVASFGLGVGIFLQMLGMPADDRAAHQALWSWIPVGNLQIDLGLQLDALSMTFVLLITGVGSLIHIYSIGYMAHDPERRKFFAYLNLFVAAMLLLVLGDGFVSLYAGWEGVGLASYLLIGFWSDRPSAASAAKKAFVMNRVGDLGLALAIFLMYRNFGGTSFAVVLNEQHLSGLAAESPATLTLIAMLLLLGACGKSGQVPLQAWLPDAMEGPTPVSALIHAATMVTAGVYLIVRSGPLFELTATGQLAVCIVGAVTLLVGCIAGCAKDDIKKVLAYSTVSQIGYMFLAAGLGAGVYAIAIMHLLTHGFFKAAMFLAAGSVMHAMNDDVDMRRMGGLAGKMPVTFAVMMCGYLAIIGFPFLSGFYSKDPIIESAFEAPGAQGWIFGTVAMIGAGITAFYMTRMMLMTFFGEARWKNLRSADGREYHPHESPISMTAPMVILAIGSLGAGAVLALGHRFADWLQPVVGAPTQHENLPISAMTITVATLVLVALGVGIAWWFFGRRPVPVTERATRNPLIRFARADAGGNFVNEKLFAGPGIALSTGLLVADNSGVDGAVNGIGTGLVGMADRIKGWQNGFVRSYALSMLAGTVVLIAAMLLVRSA